LFFFFSSRRRHTRSYGDWSSDVCSSDLQVPDLPGRELTCPFHANGLCHWPGPADNLGPAAPAASQTQRADFPLVLTAPTLNGKIVKNQSAIKQVPKERIRPGQIPIPPRIAHRDQLDTTTKLM